MAFVINTSIDRFQFHKGTIKTERLQDSVTDISHFNSIKVRLKPFSKYFSNFSFFISIP